MTADGARVCQWSDAQQQERHAPVTVARPGTHGLLPRRRQCRWARVAAANARAPGPSVTQCGRGRACDRVPDSEPDSPREAPAAGERENHVSAWPRLSCRPGRPDSDDRPRVVARTVTTIEPEPAAGSEGGPRPNSGSRPSTGTRASPALPVRTLAAGEHRQ